MITFIRRRLISSVITLMGVVVIVFFLARLTGSPADVFFPEGRQPERIDAFNRAYGLDKPLFEQFGIFLLNAAAGRLRRFDLAATLGDGGRLGRDADDAALWR